MNHFTLDEANSLIPELRRLIAKAKQELGVSYQELKQANADLIEREWHVRQARIDGVTGDLTIEELQVEWQSAADLLEQAKDAFSQLQESWLNQIHERGVILRDLQRGLIDFPAVLGDAEFYYCWTLDEDEIQHWHSRTEGFANRKPLAALASWDWTDHDEAQEESR